MIFPCVHSLPIFQASFHIAFSRQTKAGTPLLVSSSGVGDGKIELMNLLYLI
ncbi:hypothetical protein HanXRQr2_Chr11g0480681 [Helianthus annuus]|uniref:Uncharacterized protein n=1 Tax=Helianthus annuus TaxID=4232 RepID=A0A9K3HMY5_HELAN|nr:hypothetical protein HanXRQr2_Chr11g0480681 [Helianthus annuus]